MCGNGIKVGDEFSYAGPRCSRRLVADACSAAIMGLAGMFRLEAGLVAGAFAVAFGLFSGAKILRLLLLSGISMLPTAVWMLFCHSLGCSISDWRLSALPQVSMIAHAFLMEWQALVLHVLPIAVLLICLHKTRRCLLRGTFAAAVAAFILLLLLIPLLCGFYFGRHGEWMVDNTIPRLVWYLAIIPLSRIKSLPLKTSTDA